MLKPAYVPFYVRARRWIKAALERGERFDVAHQPAPVAMRYPSPVVGLGIPYLIGPVGGSVASPPAFHDDDTSPWFVGLRAFDELRMRRDPLLRRTYEEAACVVGIADYARGLLGELRTKRFVVMSETGVDAVPDPVDRDSRKDPMRLLFVGRLVRTKGARDAIGAMAHLRDLSVGLDLVGDGYDRGACESLIEDLKLADRVSLHGRVARDRVDDFYREADVFVFPSYREAGGNVLWEAMGFGLPMIVSDRGGPASAVDESCGFRIPVSTPDQYAVDIAAAVRTLHAEPLARRELGRGARARVTEVGLWSNKVDRMTELYKEVLAG
jgi:glycosyltransferase involved in cell wall biosynthesis